MGQLQARVLLELWTEGCAERIESAHVSSNKELCVVEKRTGKKKIRAPLHLYLRTE